MSKNETQTCTACKKTFSRDYASHSSDFYRYRDEYHSFFFNLEYLQTSIPHVPSEFKDKINFLIQEFNSKKEEFEKLLDELERIWQDFITEKGGEISLEVGDCLTLCDNCSQELGKRDKQLIEKVANVAETFNKKMGQLSEEVKEKIGEKELKQISDKVEGELEKKGLKNMNDINKLANERTKRIKKEREKTKKPSNSNQPPKNNLPLIIGGGVLGTVLIGLILWLVFRKKSATKS